MSPEEAAAHIHSVLSVTREDIARAKNWLVQQPGSKTSGMAEEWLREQGLVEVKEVDTDSAESEGILTGVARAFSVHLAFFQAVNELVSAAELFAAGSITRWSPYINYRTSHGGGGIPIKVHCSFPDKIERPSLSSSLPVDPDIFLKGIDIKSLHSGILEAIEQALKCFRRGLYMPATAMLAASVEATWTECGTALAKKLADAKVDALLNDPYISISKKVIETFKLCDTANGKALLKLALRGVPDVRNAEVWTTTLRERRNALHWGKAKSFLADHSETGTLLMAAPQHLGTLEAIRAVC
jgi:hypothetical protein